MKTRIAGLSDIPRIRTLYRQQFDAMSELQPYFMQPGEQSEAFIRYMVADERSDILLLDAEGALLGLCVIQEKEMPGLPFFVPRRYAYIMDLLIDRDNRHVGFGTSLMTAAKSWARARSLEYLDLDVLANNDRALHFYEKMGFEMKRHNMYLRL